MDDLNRVINEIGVSKVRLSKYLGVSRQMLYNYLGFDSLSKWPNEKVIKLFELLDIADEKNLKNIKIDSKYIERIENKLNSGTSNNSSKDANSKGEIVTDLKSFNKKEQEILTDIIGLLKEKLATDNTQDTYYSYVYLYHFLQSLDNTEELKYLLGYLSKTLGFTDPLQFVYNKDKQFVFESIMFRAFALYNNGDSSRTKIAETHKQFVQDINHKKEEKLSRTQELNSAKIQALQELGYDEINESNAREVLEKIAEIESRKV